MSMDELEKLRIKATHLQWVILAIGVLGILVFFKAKVPGIAMMLIAGLLLLTVFRKQKEKYTKAFKQTIVRESLGKKFKDISYFPEMGIREPEVMLSGLFLSGNRFSSNDLLEAKYRGIKFQQSDVSIEKETSDGDGGTNKVTLFRGRFIILEIDKLISHPIQVYGNNFNNPGKREKNSIGLLKSLTSKIDHDNWEQIEMESVEFNKKFNVFSTDAHGAFYVLTPPVMEMMEELYQKYHGKIALCFLGKRIYVGIYSETDAFEVECRGGEGFEYEQKKVNNEIKVITDLIDTIRDEDKFFEQTEEYSYS